MTIPNNLPPQSENTDLPSQTSNTEELKKRIQEGASPLQSHKKRVITVDVPTPPRARWFDRTLAALIDIALFLTPVVIAILLAASASPDARLSPLVLTIISGVIGSIGVFVGQVFLEGVYGQTLGKMILGIVVVDGTNAELIGMKRAFTRNFVKIMLDIAPAGSGVIAMARDQETVRSRADEAVNTAVLYTIRRPPVQYVEKETV